MINEEADRVDNCEALIEQATRGRFEIWTSSLTRAEVFKVKCSSNTESIQEIKDKAFEDYLDQYYVVEVEVDRKVGTFARKLMRRYSPPLKKPNDAIHLAVALIYNLDEFHTYDRDDLLRLSGIIKRNDDQPMIICETPSMMITKPEVNQQKLALDEEGKGQVAK